MNKISKKDYIINATAVNYTNKKLLSCYDHVIIPCNDDVISSWNGSSNDDKFSLKSYQELVEDGISQYNNFRS